MLTILVIVAVVEVAIYFVASLIVGDSSPSEVLKGRG